MPQSLRTCLIVATAFIAGWLACGHIMAGRAAPPPQPQMIGLRPGKGSSVGVRPGPLKRVGAYYAPPGSKQRVKLHHLFANTGQALRWAEQAFGQSRTIAYCHDGCYCIVLIDRGLPYNSWDALFFGQSGRNACELYYISYGCVTITDSGDWPDYADVSTDGCALVFQTRAGKKLAVSPFPGAPSTGP